MLSDRQLKLRKKMYHFTKISIILFLIFFVSQNLFADTHYVSKTGGHISPFTSWANAATNIQFVVNIASPGDLILITNGIYYIASEINITTELTIKSVNGAENTIFNSMGHRCFSIGGAIITIDGLTIKNGRADKGGGVLCNSGGVVQNCIITKNSATDGGGIYLYNMSMINNCIITKNTASENGGGTYCYKGGKIKNCTISENLTDNFGGGSYCYSGTIQNCTISKNTTSNGGGGMFGRKGSLIQSCIINRNYAPIGYGGGINCGDITIQNCTISDNSAENCGGLYGSEGRIYNTIIYYNVATDWNDNIYANNIEYSCSIPLPDGEGNIYFTPLFIDSENDNYHLTEFSPCIDAGTNAFAGGDWDLDGNPRIIDGRVDMGAYECLPEPNLIIILFIGLLLAFKNRF